MTSSPRAVPPYFAQFGEDRILDEIFGHRAHGTCVEVGANDGITDSMTYHFELMGWTCLLVEPIPELFGKIRDNRRCVALNCAASSSEGQATLFVAVAATGMSSIDPGRRHRKAVGRAGARLEPVVVPTRTLDSILADAAISVIDFVSIDVEGHELEVLKGFSIGKYRPRIVLVEDNSGGTDDTVPDYMDARGYAIFRRTGVNDWYARQDDRELVPEGQAESLRRKRGRAALEYRLGQRFRHVVPYAPEWLKAGIRRLLDLLTG